MLKTILTAVAVIATVAAILWMTPSVDPSHDCYVSMPDGGSRSCE